MQQAGWVHCNFLLYVLKNLVPEVYIQKGDAGVKGEAMR